MSTTGSHPAYPTTISKWVEVDDPTGQQEAGKWVSVTYPGISRREYFAAKVMAAVCAEGAHFQNGLTKREYFAAMAMQGCAAQPINHTQGTGYEDCRAIARDAVNLADALLAELDKERDS